MSQSRVVRQSSLRLRIETSSSGDSRVPRRHHKASCVPKPSSASRRPSMLLETVQPTDIDCSVWSAGAPACKPCRALVRRLHAVSEREHNQRMATLEKLRERTVQALGSHYAVEHLRAGTLEHRLEVALTAETVDDLEGVTWDLPAVGRPLGQRLRSLLRRGPKRLPTRIVFETQPQSTLRLARESCDTWLVGRSSLCDVVIDHRTVSRRHALLSCRGGQCSIQDLASTNGLELNGQRVDRALLSSGDVIVFGGFTTAVVQ
jgi:hypothetical protein